LRKENSKKPLLQARWASDNSKSYFLREWILKKDPIFNTFDKDFFYKNTIPNKITYRNNKTKYVTKNKLEKKIEHLLKEIEKRKRQYTHFTIIKKRDFKRRRKCGLLILKFNDYPLVLKLFIEKPNNFVSPYFKGLNPFFIHGLSGGINRHLLGFTRIKNLQDIKSAIESSPKWSKLITTPRKWYWTPKDCKEIELIGKNFAGAKELRTVIPSTYCIIADEIKIKNKKFSTFDKNARETCMSLCNFLELRMDPGVGNFLLEEETNKIALIDTEHFPSLTGFKNRKKFSGHLSEYFNIGIRYLDNMFLQSKRDRLKPSLGHIT